MVWPAGGVCTLWMFSSLKRRVYTRYMSRIHEDLHKPMIVIESKQPRLWPSCIYITSFFLSFARCLVKLGPSNFIRLHVDGYKLSSVLLADTSGYNLYPAALHVSGVNAVLRYMQCLQCTYTGWRKNGATLSHCIF